MSSRSLDLSFSTNDHIVKAGAGAGKTYNLVQCVYEAYMHFRTKEQKRPRFVLTTFTRKATQELRERMILKACELGDEEFFTFVTDPGHLTISTIHGVLGQFLKEFGHLHEMDISFKILEGDEEFRLLEGVARDLVLDDSVALQLMEDFSFRRLLGMFKSFHYHYGKNEEMAPPTLDEVWEHTCQFVLSKKKDIFKQIDEGVTAIDDPPYLEALEKIKEFLSLWEPGDELEVPSLPRKTKRESFPVEFHEEFGKSLKKFKSLMDEILLSKVDLGGLSLRWSEFSEVAKVYSQKLEEQKTSGGFVTLTDLENQVYRVLKQSPFLGRIFSENYDFWLIDEFQDTSSHQLSILNQLIGDRPRFVVGDPQQSIYLFRGAESEIFKKEWDRIERDQGRRSLLEKNYRSQKDLLSFFNEIMSVSGQFSAMDSHHEKKSSSAPAVFMVAETLEDELRGLYQRAIDLCGQSGRWDEICVLGRTHDDLFKVASYFKHKGIPTHVHSPSGYGTRREIQDALSIYKFFINPHDNLNLLQVLRAPWLKVSDRELKEWMSVGPASLWKEIRHKDHSAVTKLKSAEEQLIQKGLLKTFLDFLQEIEFIQKSAQFDPSGRVEANLWKLVKMLKDIEMQPGSHVLDIFSSLSQESDAVAATEPNCVNLMTIHGSKGLEFDHVFFPRLGRRFQTSKRGAIAFSASSDRFVFSVKDEDDENLVSSLEREWIDLQKVREKEEVERWFYVALTRAKESVTLSWNQKELAHDSWVKLFRLENFKSDLVSFIQGPFDDLASYKGSEGLLEVREPFMSSGDKGSALLVRSSFTEMSAEKIEAWTSKRLMNKFSAQAKGIHWHRLFEAMRFKDLDEGLSEFPFLEDLKTPPFKEILSNGHVEWGFQAKHQNQLLEGQIDLWGFDKDKNVWVIDYKTGSSKSSEQAQRQVQFYLWILRKRGVKCSAFKWAVIYPMEEKVIHGVMTDGDFDLLLKREFSLT